MNRAVGFRSWAKGNRAAKIGKAQEAWIENETIITFRKTALRPFLV